MLLQLDITSIIYLPLVILQTTHAYLVAFDNELVLVDVSPYVIREAFEMMPAQTHSLRCSASKNVRRPFSSFF